MAECLSLSLLSDVRSFGSRVYALTAEVAAPEGMPLVARLRQDATRAAVKVARAGIARDGRDVKRHLLAAFRTLSDAVTGLDALGRSETERSVEAAALAAEASDLAEQVFATLAEDAVA